MINYEAIITDESLTEEERRFEVPEPLFDEDDISEETDDAELSTEELDRLAAED